MLCNRVSCTPPRSLWCIHMHTMGEGRATPAKKKKIVLSSFTLSLSSPLLQSLLEDLWQKQTSKNKSINENERVY